MFRRMAAEHGPVRESLGMSPSAAAPRTAPPANLLATDEAHRAPMRADGVTATYTLAIELRDRASSQRTDRSDRGKPPGTTSTSGMT
jgi:hypothetical protein